MEDSEILELYFRREQGAIDETAKKYGALCSRVAMNILASEGDAEECVNDALLRAWDAIPPARPRRLGVWLARVTRNLAFDRWKSAHRQKRGGVEPLLEELAQCVPDPRDLQRELEGRELTAFMDRWLGELRPEDRRLFLRRYWRGDSVRELARDMDCTPNSVTKRLTRLRERLRAALDKEGYTV